jgi:CHAT domain-containing protein
LGSFLRTMLASAAICIQLCGAASAQIGDDTYASLRARVKQLVDSDNYAEAIPVAEQALAAAEREFGLQDPRTAKMLSGLGSLYLNANRFPDAERILSRYFSIVEPLIVDKKLEANGPELDTALGLLGMAYRGLGRLDLLEPHLKRIISLIEQTLGYDHPQLVPYLGLLAQIEPGLGRGAVVEALDERAAAIAEKALQSETPLYDVRQVKRGRPGGVGKLDLLDTLLTIAEAHRKSGKNAEAERMLTRVVAVYEADANLERADLLAPLLELGQSCASQGKLSDAQRHYRRVIQIGEQIKAADPANNQVPLQVKYAGLLLIQTIGKRNEGPALSYHDLLRDVDKPGGDPMEIAGLLTLAAWELEDRGLYAEAIKMRERTAALIESAMGPENPELAVELSRLARLYLKVKHDAEWRALSKRVDAIFAEYRRAKRETDIGVVLDNWSQFQGHRLKINAIEWARLQGIVRGIEDYGPKHPEVLERQASVARSYFEDEDWRNAFTLYNRVARAAAERMRLFGAGKEDTAGSKRYVVSVWGTQEATFDLSTKAAFRLAQEKPERAKELQTAAFDNAQDALISAAGRALALMAMHMRVGQKSPALAGLLREREDRLAERNRLEALPIKWFKQPIEQRNPKEEAEVRADLTALEGRIADIDKELALRFPDYAALVNPAPLSLEEAQAQLNADEALAVFVDTEAVKPTPEETFVMIVTKTEVRWVRSDLGAPALSREVEALRCGLDELAWVGGRCPDLTGQYYTARDRAKGRPLPFDSGRAHRLYRALFGEVEDLIKGKQLLIVPSGALTRLPFQVLVTAPPVDAGDNKSIAWLIRDHTLTVLPAVSSLKALRRVAGPSAAAKPMIGFGNPLLIGSAGETSTRAKLARETKTCADLSPKEVASAREREAPQLRALNGLTDLSSLRNMPPLPETAEELCAVARNLNADQSDIYLAERATERQVKALSESGKLAQYRIVHFATHGALPREAKGAAEPGLILTPPGEASQEDDGYLTASEIASLRLDADWVILSACNTAAGDEGGDALSGLARAFFYAQARALLVSHWAVDSAATVKLVTGALSRLASNKAVGRAEAMRQSILALIESGTQREVQPMFWAPFVVVGEGAADR